MKEIKIIFKGENSEKGAKAFFSWMVDGGGEDIIREVLEDNDFVVEKFNFDSSDLKMEFIEK